MTLVCLVRHTKYCKLCENLHKSVNELGEVVMHDFHLANKIVKIVKLAAKKNNLKKINKIFLELGDIVEHYERIKPENLKYNINLLLPCKVGIKKIKGNFWKLTSIEGK